MFDRELKKNYNNALISNNELRQRVREIEDLLCPFNKHDYIVIDEGTGSTFSYGEVETYNKRILQCKRCKKIVTDDDYITGFKYKISE